jgi:hypothetical protein
MKNIALAQQVKLSLAKKPEKTTFMGQDAVKVLIKIATELVYEGAAGFEDGPMYVPSALLESVAREWSGVPLTMEHPKLNGQFASIKSSEAMDKFAIGKVFEAKYDEETKAIVAEGVILVERANEIDPRLLAVLEAGGEVGESFGAFVKHQKVQGEFGGKKYSTMAMMIIPDHVALFANDDGACKIDDGCGAVGAKDKFGKPKIKESKMKLSADERAEKIEKIKASTSGLSEAWLNGLGCDVLSAMAENVKEPPKEDPPKEEATQEQESVAAGALDADSLAVLNEFKKLGVGNIATALDQIKTLAASNEKESTRIRSLLVKEHGFTKEVVEGMPLNALKAIEEKFAVASKASYSGMGIPSLNNDGESSGYLKPAFYGKGAEDGE